MNKSYFFKLLLIVTILASAFGCSNEAKYSQSTTKRSETITTNQTHNSKTTESINVTTTALTSKAISIADKTNGNVEKEQTEATVHFLDTGNSDAILIRKGDKTILIDGADTDDGAVLVNYLKNTGVKDIDYMINTHPDADHVGGLAEIMKSFKIGRLFVSNGDASTKTYRNFIETAGNLGLSPEVPLEGSKFNISDNSSITFFNTKAVGTNNEVSLIILFEHGTDRFLFTGDAGVEQEKKYLSDLPDINVLKVGHHGSRSSTSDDLLKSTTPEYGVITVGADNSYGHPHKEVIDRLNKKGIDVYRTDLDGNIIIKSTGNGVSVSSAKNKTKQTTTSLVVTTTTKQPSKAIVTSKISDIVTSAVITSSTTKATTQVATTSTVKSNSAGMILTPSGKTIPNNYKFKKCDEVKEYFPNGFSKDEYPELYAINPARDGDKDGWACE